jgi:hypothetical protein
MIWRETDKLFRTSSLHLSRDYPVYFSHERNNYQKRDSNPEFFLI